MARRNILDDARELLDAWAGPNPYGRVGKFVLKVDREIRAAIAALDALPPSRAINDRRAELARLRNSLGLESCPCRRSSSTPRT